MKEEEKKKAINCRFQPNESDDFFHWLNNQSNMTLAIRNLIYHAIDLYGINDFLSPDTQKEVMRNTFIFEAAKNNRVAPVNPFSNSEIMSDPVVHVEKNVKKDQEDKKEKEVHEVEVELKEDFKKDPKKNNIYENVDINNL